VGPQLDGKAALLTGAAAGIGRNVAEQLAAEGATAAISARTAAPPEVTAREIQAPIGWPLLPLAGDVSVTAAAERCRAAAGDRPGRIDILVACAGSSPGRLLEDLTEEQWMSSLNLEFAGTRA
jgi:NAD(P)-dependent dehydrogenase (short-subunit alcohol dehydrogenase family)